MRALDSIIGWWMCVPQADVVDAFAHFGLDFVDGVPQALDDGLASQRLHVEVARLRWEDQEGHDRFVRSTDLHSSKLIIKHLKYNKIINNAIRKINNK